MDYIGYKYQIESVQNRICIQNLCIVQNLWHLCSRICLYLCLALSWKFLLVLTNHQAVSARGSRPKIYGPEKLVPMYLHTQLASTIALQRQRCVTFLCHHIMLEQYRISLFMVMTLRQLKLKRFKQLSLWPHYRVG